MAFSPSGQPLTPEEVQGYLADAGVTTTVTGVTLMQAHADIPGTDKSGKHSELVRIRLEPDSAPLPRRLIVKRVPCAELPDRPAAKWKRDLRSYLNDVTFYRKYAADCEATGMRLPKCYKSVAETDPELSDPKKCSFYLLLEDLEEGGFQNRNVQNREQAGSLIRFLARLHSTRWENAAEIERDFFPTAGAQSLDKRDPKEIESIPQSWEKVLKAWPAGELPGTLGARIHAAAQRLDAHLRRDSKHTGLIHGDFKSANLFTNEAGEVCVVDWQWSGGGKVVRELPYFLWGACDPALASEEGESALLEEYHDELTKCGCDYPKDVFLSDYRVAFVDYARHVIAYMWPNNAVAKGPAATDADFRTQSRNVHNKNADVVRRFAAAADTRLTEFEQTCK
eukprot:TRINITY_DN35839_c0_g1_i1.p1 TRINITY_DN35839_c0_g1~~TRINITY_DN35839_c0_g1_i1.p1  ORF type:complete len:416 (+),score=120.76 TRINITY_DN35839_c0_g1_i1:65-1249(+)